MDEGLREYIRQRAGARCEYCGLPEAYSDAPFQVDHVIAEKHQGPTQLENLAWSCYYCNSFKGPNIAGWNEATQAIVRLYHPRRDTWEDHFRWQGAVVAGLTEVGAATIHVLRMNEPE